MEQLLSPRQVARAIGASESSLKRWCDQGVLAVVRTAGGHRRILTSEVLRFVRQSGHSLAQPEILNLPPADSRHLRSSANAACRLVDALLAENESLCRAIVRDLYLDGCGVGRILDEVVAKAFHEIGRLWECQQLEIYQERMACRLAARLLHELRTLVSHGGDSLESDIRPLAMGVTLEGDHYDLPVAMCELVLRSAGWNALLLGSSIPVDSVIKAVTARRPGLFWISVSFVHTEQLLIEGMNQIAETCAGTGTTLVIGGRVLTETLRMQLKYSAFCDTMQNLESLAIALCSRLTLSSTVAGPDQGNSSR